MAGGLYDAGAAALTIHGRTASDRYTKAADWGVIARVVDDCRARGGGMAAWFKCRPCPCLRSAPAPPQGAFGPPRECSSERLGTPRESPGHWVPSHCRGCSSRVADSTASDHPGMPIVGNGDILSYADARGQMATAGVDAVMVGPNPKTRYQALTLTMTTDPNPNPNPNPDPN